MIMIMMVMVIMMVMMIDRLIVMTMLVAIGMMGIPMVIGFFGKGLGSRGHLTRLNRWNSRR